MIDVPTSIVVLNEEFLKDVGALDTNSAFRYVSGMNSSNLYYNGQITIRGFQSGDGISYVDGLPGNIAIGGAPMNDFADVQRVEIIKGPNGVLYGSHVPGGVVNMIAKKPMFTRQTELSFVAGSYGLYRGEVDTTGPVGSSKNLAYRLIYMRQQGETYNRGPFTKTMVEPSVTFLAGQNTKVTARFMYYAPNAGTSRTPWFSDSAHAISTFISPATVYDEQDEHRQHWIYFTDVAVQHALSAHWQVRVVGRYIAGSENKLNYAHGNFRFLGPNGTALLTPTGAAATYNNYTFAQAFANPLFTDIVVDRTRQLNILKKRQPAGYLDLVGAFDTGPVHHKVVGSGQIVRGSLDTKQWLWNYPSTSVLNPVLQANSLAVATALRETQNNIAWSTGYAAGVQDNISAVDGRLNLVAGVRYDNVHSDSLNRLKDARASDVNKEKSYRAGALFKLTPALALFGNWSQTFIPVAGFNAFGVPFKNQIGTIREAGIKAMLSQQIAVSDV